MLHTEHVKEADESVEKSRVLYSGIRPCLSSRTSCMSSYVPKSALSIMRTEVFQIETLKRGPRIHDLH